MEKLIDTGCILLCLLGGGYAVWMLLDCYRQIREPRTRNNRSSWSLHIDRLSQIVAAGILLVVVGAMLASSGREYITLMSPSSSGKLADAHYRQVSGKCPISYRKLYYDSDRPGAPVVGADLASLPLADSDVRALLRSSPEIEWLNLNGTEITDEVLADVAAMPRLFNLCLANTAITDAGLAELATAKKLRVLTLSGTAITDEGLHHLSALTSLTALNLPNTRITDDGLKQLNGMTQLERLMVSETAVTPDGYRQLREGLSRLPGGAFQAR